MINREAMWHRHGLGSNGREAQYFDTRRPSISKVTFAPDGFRSFRRDIGNLGLNGVVIG
jgi:hypothetical protein